MPHAHSPCGTAPRTSADVHELIGLVYDGDFEAVHQPLREVLQDPVFDRREGLTMAEQGRLAYTRGRVVHERAVPPRDVLADPRHLYAIGEWPALLDTTTLPLLMSHYNLCLGTILDHGGGREDLDDYVGELERMESVGMLMVSELGYGNNAASLRTRATYDRARDEFVLHTPGPDAQKFMPYTGIQDVPKLAVVMARLIVEDADCGVFPFIVRISDANGLVPGVHATPLPDKPGLALDNGCTWFDHVRLPRRSLLGGAMGDLTADGQFTSPLRNRRHRFFRSLSRVHPGRLCLASSLVAAGRASLHIALRYSARRHTFAPGRDDVPLLAYRSQQLSLFCALADTYAMTFLINLAKRQYAVAPEAKETATLIAVTKAVSSWTITDCLTTLRERMGAQGMFAANRIADYVAMAQGVVTAEGDNLPLLAKAAGDLLSNSSHPGGGGRPDLHPGPPAPPSPQGRSLADPGFHDALLAWREEDLRLRTGPAIRREVRGGSSLFDAWNHHLNSALAMTTAHGERLAHNCLRQAATEARSPRVREALRLLAAVHGLARIERNSGQYLAHGALTARQTTRLPALLEELCARLLPHADLLVDGFALSDELLRAPALSPGLSAFSAWATPEPAMRRTTSASGAVVR
ncbi:acyl-CoA dehydrogenase [Streptomyces sp. NPDC048484]|uniref:acyl-CoA dehydrogenase family protein n=1 Tax=Streptomyces sp. NPDC048484 TaxID=3155146 RepID=UPI00342A2FFB